PASGLMEAVGLVTTSATIQTDPQPQLDSRTISELCSLSVQGEISWFARLPRKRWHWRRSRYSWPWSPCGYRCSGSFEPDGPPEGLTSEAAILCAAVMKPSAAMDLAGGRPASSVLAESSLAST